VNAKIRSQKAVWEQVVDYVTAHPDGVGRSDVANYFKVTRQTAKVHLEKAVERRKLQRVYTWVSTNYRGWVYYSWDTLRPMGMTIEEQMDWESDNS